jgi:enoyl-CoA hydratase
MVAMSAVEYRVEDHRAVITINRPEARNAVNEDVAQGIEAAIDRVEADDAVWLAILTGAPPAFCAGADLKAVAAGQVRAIHTKRGGFAGFTQRERAKPVIAAVDGPALAGGTEIVLACDLVVASHRSTFGIPEVKRSLAAGAGGLFRLGRKIPLNVAMECALTGDPISAERAYGFGLVNVLCEDGHALDGAVALADRVLANAPVAVRESRAIVAECTFGPDEEAWRRSRQAMSVAAASEDNREGLMAFIEKRPPNWTGR